MDQRIIRYVLLSLLLLALSVGATATADKVVVTSGRVVYDPFGRVVVTYHPIVDADSVYDFIAAIDTNAQPYQTPYRFNGKKLDEETGLYYYGTRYMNPRLSIWYGTDRLELKYPNISTYAYCAGHPINCMDIDGDSIVMRSIYKFDKIGCDNLIQDLQEITGLSLALNERKILTYEKGENSCAIFNNNGTSETARNYLIQLIDHAGYLDVKGSKDRSATPHGGSMIKLSPIQIKEFIDGGHNLDSRTLGWGMVFFHESRHTKFGGSENDVIGGFGTGNVVDFMNRIRKELGPSFGERLNYEAIPIGSKSYIPFDSSSFFDLKRGYKPSQKSKFISF